MRRHKVEQRADVSFSSSKTNQEDDDVSGNVDEIKSGRADDEKGNIAGLSLDLGWTLALIPGRIERDQLRINSLGWGYSMGFLGSFTKHNDLVTSSWMLKLGIETGNGHMLGTGADLLGGVGTNPVEEVYENMGEGGSDYTAMDNRWCFKYGFQVWLRCNFLKTGIKGTDVRLFVRYIMAKDPTDDADFIVDNQSVGFYLWTPDQWKVGLCFSYTF